jgi:HD-like signal output (HDOD) protein
MANRIRTIPEDCSAAIAAGAPFVLEFRTFDKNAESLLLKVLRRYLARFDMLYIRDVLITILKELITNGVKANAKRFYFQTSNLDITNPDDYAKGMVTFKADVLHPGSDLLERLEETEYHVQINFESTETTLIIKVLNNIPIVEDELRKIRTRIEKAYVYNDITEAFAEVLDDSEGAGLGLIMAMMVFRNAGFDRKDFIIENTPGDTVFGIRVAQRFDIRDYHTKLTDEIILAVDTIPSLPENVRQLQELCDHPHIAIKEIADFVRRDPALAASILRLANSAGYAPGRKITGLDDAVMIIGLKGIKTIALASGVETVISARFREFKNIWAESYKMAFYAYKIAIQLNSPGLSETAYLAALLSKIGRILLLSLNQDTVNRLLGIAGAGGIADTDALEEMTLGISQTTLGSLIIRRWQFDESLAATIEYYRRPHIAPEEYRALVYIVYLAHVFCETESGHYRFEIVDDDVLNYFQLSRAENFSKLHDILMDAYSAGTLNT